MKTTDMRFYAKHKAMVLAVFSFLLTTCGIDEEPYLEPVGDASSVVVTANTSASIVGLTTSGEDRYSPNFLLYYKIYISGANELATITPDAMSRINPTLSSDYNGISYYTTSNTANRPVFTPTIFSNRNFYPMVIDKYGEILPESTKSIMIDFGNSYPALTLTDNNNVTDTQTLYRSNGGGSFTPRPDDRRFRNFNELQETQNRDVAQSSASTDYAYCAVYIIKRGINQLTLTAIYSAPTFVAVFRLPESY
jgi:hypothetical protein